MARNKTLKTNEHREHAEHAAHASGPLIACVSITVAFFTVLSAVAGGR